MIEIFSNKTKEGQDYLKKDLEFRYFSDPFKVDAHILVFQERILGLAVFIKDWANTNVFTNFEKGFIHLRIRDQKIENYERCLNALKDSVLWKLSRHIMTAAPPYNTEVVNYLSSIGFIAYDESIYMSINMDDVREEDIKGLNFIPRTIKRGEDIDEFFKLLIAIYEGSEDLPVIRVKAFLNKASDSEKKMFYDAGFLNYVSYFIFYLAEEHPADGGRDECQPEAERRKIHKSHLKSTTDVRLRISIYDDEKKEIAGLLQIDESTGFVANVGILKKFRKMGMGERAMKFALNRFKKSGCKVSTLRVHSKNDPAISLYKKLGYCIEREALGMIK